MPSTIDHTIKTRLLLRPIKSPLGTIRLGGVNQGGVGVGRPPGPPRTLNCYAIGYILGGEGIYEDRHTRPTRVAKGDFTIFFPQRPHRCGTAPGKFWDEIWFEFEGPAFDLMRKTGLLDPRYPVQHTQDSNAWFRRFFQLIPPLHLRRRVPPQVTVGRFVAALTELLADRVVEDEAPPAAGEWLDRACALLAPADAGRPRHPKQVAEALGVSYESFRKKFRAALGFSPGRFLLDSRIDRAAALLHQGRLTIKEIAAQLDFCDEFYFSRCFKRRFGQSPRAFRRRVRG